MKYKDLDKARCPIARSLESIGDAWSLLIVRDAMLGMRRFGEFQKSLGTAKNILTARLKKLVSQGVLELVPGERAFSEYILTDKGRNLYLVLLALRQWGEDCLYQPGELDLRLVDQKNGQPVGGLEVRSQDGRLLKPGDMKVVEQGR